MRILNGLADTKNCHGYRADIEQSFVFHLNYRCIPLELVQMWGWLLHWRPKYQYLQNDAVSVKKIQGQIS